MKTIRFKTNMMCANCVGKVTPFLNKKDGISSWNVDTKHPDKILTVETETLSPDDIVKVVKRTGFTAKEIE